MVAIRSLQWSNIFKSCLFPLCGLYPDIQMGVCPNPLEKSERADSEMSAPIIRVACSYLTLTIPYLWAQKTGAQKLFCALANILSSIYFHKDPEGLSTWKYTSEIESLDYESHPPTPTKLTFLKEENSVLNEKSLTWTQCAQQILWQYAWQI